MAIDAWTVHCPDCSSEVTVEEGASAVACPQCSTVFPPGGVPTAAGRPPVQAAPKDASDSLVGTTLGRWRLERLLGKGGMGRVYEGRDPKDGRRVALKVLPDDLAADSSFVGRFHREAKLLAELSHPHIVEVYDGGEEKGRLWFAMEYVRGENLRRRIERGRLAPREAGRIAAEVASALTYAHGRRVVHRDLKPENVLLDESGNVHLADFGLSRLVRADAGTATTNLTRTDVILGTYEYMAPEQRRGSSEVDGRADLYALGVILYEMLTGTLPFGRFSPASQVAPGVPPALDAVVNRALAPDRESRYPDAAAVREAVLAATAGAPERAAAPPAAPGTVTVSEAELRDARGVLRHVDILSGLDRALGVLLMLAFFGLSMWWLPSKRGLGGMVGLSSVILLVAGALMLSLGKRLSRMGYHSRESQITASFILLFFPPFLTAMGIYGLVVMTTDRARRAFALGRKALVGPAPVVIREPVVVVAPRPPQRDGPSFGMRFLLLAAVLWTVYVGVAATSGGPEDFGGAFVASVVALAVSLAILGRAIVLRRRRHGLGIAVAITVLCALCVAILWDPAAAHVFHLGFRSPFRLEIHR